MIGAIHFRIAGVILIALALSHAWFPRKLGWTNDLRHMSLLNRQIFLVHSFFIALFVFLNGLLFLGWPGLLLQRSQLRNVVCVGIGLFWLCRFVVQLFIYDRSHWRGHRGKTIIHVCFTLFWAYLVVISFGVVVM